MKTKKISLFGFIVMFFLAQANLLFAQETNNVNISGQTNFNDQYVVQVMDLSNKSLIDEFPVQLNGDFQLALGLDQPSWIEVSFMPVKKDRQLGASFPLYVKPGDQLNLKFNYEKETYLQLLPGSSKSENLALIEYASFSNRTMRDLFFKRDSVALYAKAVESYLSKAAELAKTYKLKSKNIVNYLKLWSYNNYLSVATTNKAIKISAERNKEIPAIMDSELTLMFWNGPNNVNNYVSSFLNNENDPFKRIELKMEKLNELFKTKKLILSIIKNDLERYVSSYKIIDMDTFQKDIAGLEGLMNKIGDEQLTQAVMGDFRNLHYTSVGSLIPDIKFKDASGKDVSLDQFKGKYIYIDLWASWCVPCIKEIPYLLALEKLYKDKNLVFVSISLDADKAAWRKKMEELNLHGHQWELGNSNFDKLMNVTGIPHFILYGPDRKLIHYQAPRPSSQEIKTIFNKL